MRGKHPPNKRKFGRFKGILLIIIFFLLTNIVQGALSDNINQSFTFDNESNQCDDSSDSQIDCSVVSTATHIGGSSCFNNNCTDMAGGYLDLNKHLSGSDKTISFWVNFDGVIPGRRIFGSLETPTARFYFTTSDGTPEYVMRLGTDDTDFTPHVPNVGVWEHIIIIHNTTGDYTIPFINGSNVTRQNDPSDSAVDYFLGELSVDGIADGTPFDGQMDEFVMWDRILSDSEISQLYNNGAGTFFPFIDNTPPIVNIISPKDGDKNNTDIITFKVNSTDSESNNVTCELKNETQIFDSATLTTDIFLLNFTTVENTFSEIEFTVECFDNTNNNNSANQSVNIIIDRINPVLTINAPVNNSFIGDDFLIDLLCQDQNDTLSVNYTLFRTDAPGSIIRSQENNSITTEALTIKDTVPISILSDGEHQINITCKDAHTAQKILPIDREIDVATGYIKFTQKDFQLEIKLIQSPGAFSLNYMSTRCLKDRCTFVYSDTTKKVRGKYVLEVISNKKLKYHPESSYPAHFTSLDNWLDFVNKDPDATYRVIKINNYKYNVEVTTDDLNFSSMGELNTVNAFLLFNADQNGPVITATPANNSFILSSPFNITLNVTDNSNFNMSCRESDITNTTVTTIDNVVSIFYRFEEGSGINATDSSLNNFHGVITGANYVGSRITNNTGDFALEFAESDFIQTPDPGFNITTGELTFCFHINSTDLDGDIIDKQDEGSSEGFKAIMAGGMVTCAMGDKTATTTANIDDGRYHHICCISNATHTEIYHDGNLEESTSESSTTLSSNVDLFIGKRSDDTSQFSGFLDEMFALNISLTSDQISNVTTFGIDDLFFSDSEITVFPELFNFPQGNINFQVNATEGHNQYNFTCFDNVPDINNSAFIYLNYSLDTIFPFINVNSPTVGQSINENVFNLTIDNNCTDSNLLDFRTSVFNESDVLFFQINTTFTGGTSVIISEVDLFGVSFGNYTVLHNCTDQTNKRTLTQFDIQIFGQPIVNLLLPANNSVNRNGIVDFTFESNELTNCDLIINNVTVDTIAGINGNVTFPTRTFTTNQSIVWGVNCTINGFSDAEFFLLTLNLTSQPVPFFEKFRLSNLNCPDTIADVMLLGIFFLLAMVFIFMGITFRWALIGLLGGFVLLGTSLFIVGCSLFIASFMIGISLLIMGVFAFTEEI